MRVCIWGAGVVALSPHRWAPLRRTRSAPVGPRCGHAEIVEIVEGADVGPDVDADRSEHPEGGGLVVDDEYKRLVVVVGEEPCNVCSQHLEGDGLRVVRASLKANISNQHICSCR